MVGNHIQLGHTMGRSYTRSSSNCATLRKRICIPLQQLHNKCAQLLHEQSSSSSGKVTDPTSREQLVAFTVPHLTSLIAVCEKTSSLYLLGALTDVIFLFAL